MYKFLSKTTTAVSSKDWDYEIPVGDDPDEKYFLPRLDNGEVIHHHFFSLSYNEDHEQSNWVAYELTKKSIQIPNVPRAKNYVVDPKVSTGTAKPYDLKGSGYTRGHLAPAGDMAFKSIAMEESFYMSNISPQLRQFNDGVWRMLEEQVRDWAYKKDRIFVTTGPVLNKAKLKSIQGKDISIPELFYKVLIDIDGKEQAAIGFIVPHETNDKNLKNFMVTVDSVEALTGIDFFADLVSEKLEQKLEKEFDPQKWLIKSSFVK